MIKNRSTAKGFTLIEILVALAIFSIVTIMGAQALSQASKQSGILKSRQDAQREALVLMRLLEADWLVAANQTEASLIAARRPALWEALEDGQQLDLHGVRWVWRGQRLSRQLQGQSDPLQFGLKVEQLRFRWFQSGGLRDWTALDARLPVEAVEMEMVINGAEGPIRQLVALSAVGL